MSLDWQIGDGKTPSQEWRALANPVRDAIIWGTMFLDMGGVKNDKDVDEYTSSA